MMKSATGDSWEGDKEQLITYVEDPRQRYFFHYGEAFRYEPLPVGTRVIYPPPPLHPIQDVDGAIEHALQNPLEADPLSAQLKAGMKVTIAFDDISLPLPPMQSPDLRRRIIEKVLEKLSAKGVDDIHLIPALGLHRHMTPNELRRILGSRIFKSFFPDRLYNFDAEDPENLVVLGKTPQGQEIEMSRRVAESDLLIYVNINLASMDGGHKSINTGLVSYRTIRHHHNVHSLMHCESYMDPNRSALHDTCNAMGSVVEKNLKVFKIETAINSNSFPPVLGHLQKKEQQWNVVDASLFHINRHSLDFMPHRLRWSIFQSIRAPYGLTNIVAGSTEPVHQKILDSVFRQQAVPVKGQADVVIAGLPYLGPYNVNSYLNPILIHCLALGYVFNLYRGKPLVRKGGVLILVHPMDERFTRKHHPSYIDFYNHVLSETRNPSEIERNFEGAYAHNEHYIDLYRHSNAYHGVHPFYMWYWACYAQNYLGRVIAAGAKNTKVCQRLGYDAAPNLQTALEMAKDTVGDNPALTVYHFPPIFICDVE